jgi:hypothetical protein
MIDTVASFFLGVLIFYSLKWNWQARTEIKKVRQELDELTRRLT